MALLNIDICAVKKNLWICEVRCLSCDCDDYCGPLLPHRFNATDTVILPTKTVTVIHPVSRLLIGSFISFYILFQWKKEKKRKEEETKYFFQHFFPTNKISDWKVVNYVLFSAANRGGKPQIISTQARHTQVSSSASHALNRSSPLYMLPSWKNTSIDIFINISIL